MILVTAHVLYFPQKVEFITNLQNIKVGGVYQFTFSEKSNCNDYNDYLSCLSASYYVVDSLAFIANGGCFYTDILPSQRKEIIGYKFVAPEQDNNYVITTTIKDKINDTTVYNSSSINKGYIVNKAVFNTIPLSMQVKSVFFNKYDNVTCVCWKDGTKTILHCDTQDVWDEEKAIAMAFMKKCLGNDKQHQKFIKIALKKAKRFDKLERKFK